MAYPIAYSAGPRRRASTATGSQIVTVRQYYRNGNYLGSIVTTSTDASLMVK